MNVPLRSLIAQLESDLAESLEALNNGQPDIARKKVVHAQATTDVLKRRQDSMCGICLPILTKLPPAEVEDSFIERYYRISNHDQAGGGKGSGRT